MKRRIACLAVCLLAVLLPLRALAAEETAAVQTRTGDWTPSRAMPGEELHFRATLTLRTGESWTVRSVFFPGVEFLALTAVRADGESAFALHLSAQFSARESVCLTVEWTARLGDACLTGAGGNSVSLIAESESGKTVTSGGAEVFAYGFSVFRGVRFAEARVADHPLPSACFRLYYDAAEDGYVRMAGLPAGTYYLQESRPPSGYGCAADMLRVTLTEDGALETDASEASGSTVLLLETAQESLPENKTLTFYRRGCGVMAMLFTTVLCGKRRYW